MNKKKYPILTVLLCLFVASVFIACSGKAKQTESDNEYNWSYHAPMSEECDDDMKIDGVLDEARWQGKKQLVHSDRGITFSVTTAFSEKGVYIGAVAHDENMTYAKRMNYMSNSCFWFSVKREDVTYAVGSDVFDFYVDGKTASCMNEIRFNAKGVTDKPYGENPETLTAELFVSWQALNIKIGDDGELPDCIRINPHYRYVSSTSTNAWVVPMFFFDERDRQECSARFGADGYINADTQDSSVGNAATGYAKSDGWNLDAADSGVVVSDVDHSQGIFFKDVYSEKYTYSVRVSISDENLYGKNPSGAGVMDALNQTECSTFYLDAMSMRAKSQALYSTLSFYRDGAYAWNYKGEGYFTPEYKDGKSVTYTVIKDGGNFYYVVDGVFLMSKYISYLSGATCPGFFALDAKATFSDYSAEDLSNNDAKIDEILASFGTYRIKTPETVTGGAVELSANAVKSGEDVTVTLLPSSGFVLTGLSIDGSDKYDEILPKMQNGSFTIENVTATTTILPTFTRVRDTVRIFGLLRDNKGKPVSRAQISLKGDSGSMCYVASSDETGSYAFNVPAAGKSTVGGREFDFGSLYSVTVKATGFSYLSDTIALDENKTLNKNYTLERPEYSKESYGVIELGENVYAAADVLKRRHSDYKFFDTKDVTTAVIKMKIALIGDAASKLPSGYGVGLAITDGTVLKEDFADTENMVRKAGEYYTKEFGISELGVYCDSYMIGAKSRFPGVWGGGTFSELQYSDAGLSVWSGANEREFKVLLVNNRLYAYIDDKFIIDVAADRSDYWIGNFTTGKYRFGVFFTGTNGAEISVGVDEIYGDDATAYIREHHGDVLNITRERITEENGVFTDTGSSYRTSAYAFTSPETYDDVAVYSMNINVETLDGTNGAIKGYNDWSALIGLTITDGTYMDELIDGRDASGGRFYAAQIGLTGEGLASMLGGVMGKQRRITKTGFDYSAPVEEIALTAGNMTNRLLTFALYKDKLYIYADGAYYTAVSLTDPNLTILSYSFKSGGKYALGVNMTNVDRSKFKASVEVVTELYGEEALAEIRENFGEIAAA